MSVEVKIPAVGESITSGLLSTWHKKDGETVSAGDALLTLDTDKISTEIAAEQAGVLKIKVPAGQEVKIGEVVATIDEAPAPSTDKSAAPAAGSSDEGTTTTEVKAKPDPNRAEAPKSGEKKSPNADVASPAVRKIAEEEKLDLGALSGSGKGGRVTKGDALEAVKSKAEATPAVAAPVSQEEKAPTVAPSSNERSTRRKMSPLRRKIAAQLVMAQQTAAILTTFNECDTSAMQKLRKEKQEAFSKSHGFKLGFMSFFIKAAVEAIKAVPSINSRIEGDDFIQNHSFDIGVAVGTDRGLVVPVIRDADKKSFADLERDIVGFATKAREGKIKIEDLQGGTFTISNGGVYGSLLSTPILNPPQSGIMGMHKIMDRAVVIEGRIEARPMMYLALSYDHRAVDGKEAVTFLVKVKECIENPTSLPLDF